MSNRKSPEERRKEIAAQWMADMLERAKTIIGQQNVYDGLPTTTSIWLSDLETGPKDDEKTSGAI